MGPMALLDEVGIDVASKVAVILGDAFGARMKRSTVVEMLYADGRHGKKNGKGLYVYKDGKAAGARLVGLQGHRRVVAASGGCARRRRADDAGDDQ